MSHFVYVINAVGTSDYKIGLSNNAVSRLHALQTSNSHQLTLLRVYEFPALKLARIVEKHLHARFQHQRLQGEWFCLEKRDVDEISSIVDAFNCGYVSGYKSQGMEEKERKPEREPISQWWNILSGVIVGDPDWVVSRETIRAPFDVKEYIRRLQILAYGYFFKDGKKRYPFVRADLELLSESKHGHVPRTLRDDREE